MRLTTFFLLIQYIFSPVFVVLKSCTLCSLQTLVLFVPFVTTTVEGKYLRDKKNGDGSADDIPNIVLPPYFSSVSDITGPITDERTSTTRIPNRVVWISGPHKTASSSIQANMMRWTSEEDYILKNWAWPEAEVCSEYPRHTSKGMYKLFVAFQHKTEQKCIPDDMSSDEIIEMYRREFAKAWMSGYDLIIASEGMDIFNSDYHGEGKLWLEELMDLMPWRNSVRVQMMSETNQHEGQEANNEVSLIDLEGNDDMVTVVVKYRAPRVEHLISMWHQIGGIEKRSFTAFLIFISHKPDWIKEFLDSLGLVQRYLNYGLKVVLIDLGGVVSHGLDVSDVIACEVLESARCPQGNNQGNDGSDGGEGPIIANVRKRDDSNISQNKLDLLEFVVQNYDCQYEDMIRQANPNLTLLYPDMMLKNLDECQNIPLKMRIRSIDQLSHAIGKISSMPNEDEEEGIGEEEQS